MSHLGFTVRDYSTGARIGAPPGDDLMVVVPRRPSTLSPLVESSFSSVRLRDRRLYFPTARNGNGDVIVADVPVGTYEVSFYAKGYVPLRMPIVSPLAKPELVRLHRDPSFRFGAEDTLIVGDVIRASGGVHTGFFVTFIDSTEPIPQHEVPLNHKGQFVIFVPEKRTTGGVDLHVHHQGGGFVVVPLTTVALGRRNIARQLLTSSTITVP